MGSGQSTRMCLAFLAAAIFVSGCSKPAPPPAPEKKSPIVPQSFGYFKTHFQDESQFIVETIVSDLVEMACFARDRTLPETNGVLVQAVERPGAPFRAPIYDVEIDLHPGQPPLKIELNVTGPIWSPDTYAAVTGALFADLKLARDRPGGGAADDFSSILLLTDSRAETIEKENQAISGELSRDFQNPALHEKAALILGAFGLREYCPDFYDVRSPLCRMTAHLAFARALAKQEAVSADGRLADAMLDTLMNNEASALEKLAALESADGRFETWVRALRARNTGDYRLVSGSDSTTLERVAWFQAYTRSVSVDMAWNRLGGKDLQCPDFYRIANSHPASVQVRRQLVQKSLPLELDEIKSVYRLSRGQELDQGQLAEALNPAPDGCFFVAPDGVTVEVIGWGQWAMFFQSELCHTICKSASSMQSCASPEEAANFADNCDKSFGGLRLYPFVQRFICTNERSYHRSVNDGFLVTVDSPHLVAPEIWNSLCYPVAFASLYVPVDPHINEWHKHNPPPGTAYNPAPRLIQPSLVEREDASAQVMALHDLAPYDPDISGHLLDLVYTNDPSPGAVQDTFRPVIDFSAVAMDKVAEAATNKPATYEKWMNTAAALDPEYFYRLSDYFRGATQPDKAALYLQKAIDLDPDRVMASNEADWLIRYYLRKGKVDDARKLADMAGEVDSFGGLSAKASFLEATAKYDDAFEWYAKLERRYQTPAELTSFCYRYKAKTGDKRFDPELKKRLDVLFPNGIERVVVGDFQLAPTDGVVISEENDLVRAAGLSEGDIIVAASGIRVHNLAQYNFARDTSASPQLDLVLWGSRYREISAGSSSDDEDGDSGMRTFRVPFSGYHEVLASPPNHRFGARFLSYP